MMRFINRYSWHEKKGDYAAQELFKNLSVDCRLDFEIIVPDGPGLHPDAWILKDGEHIALSEVKMVEYKTPKKGVHRITTPKTIRNAISKAKSQLKARDTDLPRVLYLICDASFSNVQEIEEALYGPWITVERQGSVVYNGFRGLHVGHRLAEDDKFKDAILSAIFCVHDYGDQRHYSIFQNLTSVPLPDVLIPQNASIYKYLGNMKRAG